MIANWTVQDQQAYEREMAKRAAEEKQRKRAARKYKRLRKRMEPAAVWVHLTEEAPVIGSGHRRVWVERLGPKWVKIRSLTSGRAKILLRKEWDRLTS